MARDVVGLVVSLLGVVGILFFVVGTLRSSDPGRVWQERLRGLTLRDRRVMRRCLRRREPVPRALEGAARPLAEHLAGQRLPAGSNASLGLSLTGLLIQPERGLLGAVLHVYLTVVLVFIVVSTVWMLWCASVGLRYLRTLGDGDGVASTAG